MSERLAITGGRPLLDTKSIKPRPVIDERDRRAVLRVFDTGFLGAGKRVDACAFREKAFRFFGMGGRAAETGS